MPTDLETHPGPVEFDPFSDEYFNDPTATYAPPPGRGPGVLQRALRVLRPEPLRRRRVARRSTGGRSRATYGIDLATLRRRKHLGMDMIIMMDPPKHDRMRALVSRVFTPRAIGALEPMIREVITGYARPGRRDAAGFDAVADFSAPFPVEIISRMLGVPEGDRQQIRHWLDVSLHREHGNPDPTHEGVSRHARLGRLLPGAHRREAGQSRRRHAEPT